MSSELHADLQAAYGHFNVHLFDGNLPPCVITLQRKGVRVMGYFSPKRFAARAGKASTDEIAMNPMHFKTKNDVEILQTLVHEMVHLWQAHFGKPSRGGYHNSEWAEKMEAVGLVPSSTGRVGGAKTGQAMNDYVLVGGAFEGAAKALVAEGFKLAWYEPSAVRVASGGDSGVAVPVKSGTRVVFHCPKCKARAWGKASLNLLCGVCRVGFVVKGD